MAGVRSSSDPLVGGLTVRAHGSGDRAVRARDTRRRLQDKPANRRTTRGACDPKVVPGLYPGLCGYRALTSLSVDPPTARREVVETRRLELLTLSLQRRCSAN